MLIMRASRAVFCPNSGRNLALTALIHQDEGVDADLISRVAASTGLSAGEAARVVADVVGWYREPVEDYVRRRHAHLKMFGCKNQRDLRSDRGGTRRPGWSPPPTCRSGSFAGSSTAEPSWPRPTARQRRLAAHVRNRRLHRQPERRPDPDGRPVPARVPRLRLGRHRDHLADGDPGLPPGRPGARAGGIAAAAADRQGRHRAYPLGHARPGHAGQRASAGRARTAGSASSTTASSTTRPSCGSGCRPRARPSAPRPTPRCSRT